MVASEIILSDEQQLFVSKALIGKNILVDACIGSGKTTAIQQLCNTFPSDKKVLYLTYNKLLKIDAINKIKRKKVTVTNYHGFAYMILKRIGKSAGISDMIQLFLKEIDTVPEYDVLIIDEYQDIDQELSELLEVIKTSNPEMQIIAVGDMEQKIYDKTSLDVRAFINIFLDKHEKLEFTKCFRISEEFAAMLGRIWRKKIVGVNNNCSIEDMTMDEVVEYLAIQKPEDILCLGSREHKLAVLLNQLETNYPEKFNKSTVYASISERESSGSTEPKSTSAIFTTYDSSKGMERKICVLFDYTEAYWGIRINQPQVSYEILRNIFCVAASRGKEKIIFVKESDKKLSEKTLSTYITTRNEFKRFNMSQMFDFKYKEDVEHCFNQLKVLKMELNDKNVIEINNKDELIDLSPCIGIYQEAVFFENYDIDDAILRNLMFKNQESKYSKEERLQSLDEKILLLTSLETNQKRYREQVIIPFVTEEQREQIVTRIQSQFKSDEDAQVECELHFAIQESGGVSFSAKGYADVVVDNTVYELKFVSELTHEHFLQCACYMVALKLKKGILWNTRDNLMYQIEIPNEQGFLDSVLNAITKGSINKYYCPDFLSNDEKFAVIDIETTWDDRVMSIGVVIGNLETLEIKDSKYYLINPECTMHGMYSDALKMPGINEYIEDNRKSVMDQIVSWLEKNNVKRILAYNASFDKSHLEELDDFLWCDIMRLAANKQFNKSISDEVECFGTGKMKKGYGVEPIFRMISGVQDYSETHNAYYDAIDEFKIVQLLGHPIETYDIGIIGDKKTSTKSIRKIQKVNDQIIIKEQKMINKTYTQLGEDNIQSVDQIYSTAEVANILGVSKSTVYNMIKQGVFSAEKKGNRYIISASEVQEYIERKMILSKQGYSWQR